jgi:Na+/melibiose symporter-like transporter
MWLSWIFACSVIGFKPQKKETVNRIVVIIAALVMSAVYLIPHSMRGSELDYSKLEEGVPVHEAIGTSEH